MIHGIVFYGRKGGDIMTNKKDLFVAIVATFCLTTTLFLLIPTRSQSPSGTYDPWIDLNDDGTIDILDAIELSNHFLTSGTPINKTELLLELEGRLDSLNSSLLALQAVFNTRITTLEATVSEQQAIIAGLETEFTSLNDTAMELQNTTEYLNTTVEYLNDTIIVLNSSKALGHPDYDSGWVAIPGTYNYFTDNLNTTNIFFIMMGMDSSGKIHQWHYGGFENEYKEHSGASIYNIDANTFMIYREIGDPFWPYARVLIWKL
jgi:uncharacterized coiled-coil protein SlyX